MNFEKGMAQVFTLLPDMSQATFGQLQKDTLQFAKDMKVPVDEVIPTLYDAIGSGVPEENVFSFMETAQKGAVAGATNIGVAVDTLTSLTNAYGAENLSAAEASDILFTGINVGKMSFEELQKSLYEVVPTSASLEVPLSDVSAALATMTAQGTPTNVATAQIRQLMVELSKEGTNASDTFKELSGKSFAQFIKEGGNLEGAIQIMSEGFTKTSPGAQKLQKAIQDLSDPTTGIAKEFEALAGKSFADFQREGRTTQQAMEMLGIKTGDASDRLSDMFGSIEAGNAILQLSGRSAELFHQNVEAMGDSAGATEEADIIGGSLLFPP